MRETARHAVGREHMILRLAVVSSVVAAFLLPAPLTGKERLESLRILQDEHPRVFFFRQSEYLAAGRNASYAPLQDAYDRFLVDVLGALSMLVSHRAALGETVPHFVDWTIQHRENPDWLLAWHCGNAPVCLAKDREKTAVRSRKDMKGELSPTENDPMAGLAQFQVKPGRVTFCRLAEYDGQWKMLITTGEVIPSDEELAGTWGWVEVADHDRLYRTLVEEGFIHHASMIHGDYVKPLLEACRFLDIEPVVV